MRSPFRTTPRTLTKKARREAAAQHKADGYILSCIEPYGRCAMNLPPGSERSTPGRKAGVAACGRIGQVKDTRALNAHKALRAAPISMGRGEIPVELRQQPSVFASLIINTVLLKGGRYIITGGVVFYEHERHSYLGKIHAYHRGGV